MFPIDNLSAQVLKVDIYRHIGRHIRISNNQWPRCDIAWLYIRLFNRFSETLDINITYIYNCINTAWMYQMHCVTIHIFPKNKNLILKTTWSSKVHVHLSSSCYFKFISIRQLSQYTCMVNHLITIFVKSVGMTEHSHSVLFVNPLDVNTVNNTIGIWNFLNLNLSNMKAKYRGIFGLNIFT